uniref:Tubulin--tyrosine ligase-like protein 9 n=1 Tax=Globisporangium ultimum (strain ATCC 200006 / CBS 805.95 / DAOM BR144) TaxID=431595 RepID=K3W522_GLOUD
MALTPPRFFVADDKFGDVIRCLEARGWTRFAHTSFPKFQLKWVNYSRIAWGSSSVERLQPAQVVNHFRNAVLFSQKDVFARALYAYECCGGAGEEAAVGAVAVVVAQEHPPEVDTFYPRTFDLVQREDTVLLQEWFLYSQALAIAKSYAARGAGGAAHEDLMLSTAMALLTVVIEHGAVFFSRTQRNRALAWPRVTILDVGAPQWEPLRRRRNAAAAATSAPIARSEVSEAAIKRMLEALKSLDPQFHAVGYENQNVWICKPSNLSQGRGIHLLTSLDAILALQTQDTGARRRNNAAGSEHQSPPKWVVQKYIERPLLGLQRGRKFDVRQWVLIDSLGPPLRVFWYRKCYLRFCSQPFSLDVDRLDNEFVHLSNYSVQCKSVAGNAHGGLTGEDESPQELMWGSDTFQAHLR